MAWVRCGFRGARRGRRAGIDRVKEQPPRFAALACARSVSKQILHFKAWLSNDRPKYGGQAALAARLLFSVCYGVVMNLHIPQNALSSDLYGEDNFVARKPFLKWAGNKNRVKHHIVPRLPKGKRLVEPFAGSCAISLASDYDSYLDRQIR